MTLKKRLAGRAAMLACAAAIAAGVTLAGVGPARAEMPPALTAADVRAYSAAFAATERGDFIDAQMQAAAAKDDSLQGYLSFRQLMHPTAHIAAFDELAGWLGKFRDLPVADRIFALASKRKTDPSLEAPRPLLSMNDGGYAPVQQLSDKAMRAREAFFGGDVNKGLRLAEAAGDRWIQGLASWRLKAYGDAQRYFLSLAQDSDTDAWTQSAAYLWAARSADQLGDVNAAADHLRAAARNGETFYGMVAARQLRLAGEASTAAAGDRVAQLILAAYTAPSGELSQFVRSDPRAHRAAALAQIGRGSEAIQELRAGLMLARTTQDQAQWRALTLAMGTSLADRPVPPRSYDLDYQQPELVPLGGFTLDKALVYAVVRQESRFNPQAISRVGATGLMQVMPASAAIAEGDDRLKSDRTPLFDPAFNLRVGQDYFAWLLQRGVGHDLMRAVAAYNGGPGAVLKTLQILGSDADPLTIMECLPAQETRAYVQRVMAGYWTYRKMWGQDSATLDAVAAGARLIDERFDYLGQPPSSQPGRAPTQEAAQSFEVGSR
jgi:soluble lytic murein transglycosylase-like protein